MGMRPKRENTGHSTEYDVHRYPRVFNIDKTVFEWLFARNICRRQLEDIFDAPTSLHPLSISFKSIALRTFPQCQRLEGSKFSLDALSDPKKNPFDVQADNAELCVTLQRNTVYFTSEMLLPALVTSMFTMSAVFFQLSKTQPMLLGFSVVSQILSLILVSQRLPSFTAHTPAILRFVGFNLVMTAVLFVVSLVLERMASTPSDIPPPHTVDTVVGLVDKVLPLPKSTKHEDESLKYAPPAHCLNHIIFASSSIVYFFVIVLSFVF